MDAIAGEAGVAVQTVYAALGSKKGILMALLDEMAEDADVAGMRAAVAVAAGDHARQLREGVAFTTRLFAGGAELIEISRTVSGLEPDLREMWVEGEARRHARVTDLVAEWERDGVLAEGCPPGRPQT